MYGLWVQKGKIPHFRTKSAQSFLYMQARLFSSEQLLRHFFNVDQIKRTIRRSRQCSQILCFKKSIRITAGVISSRGWHATNRIIFWGFYRKFLQCPGSSRFAALILTSRLIGLIECSAQRYFLYFFTKNRAPLGSDDCVTGISSEAVATVGVAAAKVCHTESDKAMAKEGRERREV